MIYILKQYNTDLLTFELSSAFDGVIIRNVHQYPEAAHLLPLDLLPTVESLTRWIKLRTIPSNRAYMKNFLSKLGLNEKDTKGIIDISKGLSLSDSYWIVTESFSGSFSDYNLYENRFSRILSLIAFTGFGSYIKSDFLSSPEFTTNGMLPKSWRRDHGKILLYKSGIEGFANSGKEPYSEYYAWQIAQVMGIQAIPYNLAKWDKRLCSTCELFTDIDTSFIPVGRLVREGGICSVILYYKDLGEKYYQALADMLVFDAVICNTDRHFGNFGFLIDNKTNTITSPAPIFDNGLSLFNGALEDDLAHLDKYLNTLRPAAYPDFVLMAREMMGKRQKDALRRLLNFTFKKHSRYNLENDRLKTIESFIQKRSKELLE